MGLIRVIVSGAAGKMGLETIRALEGAPDMRLVGALSPRHAGQDAGEIAGIGSLGLPLGASLDQLSDEADVLVDFTTPAAVKGTAIKALKRGLRPVLGTTGLSADDLAELKSLAEAKGLGVLVAPNFAIGALLMMQFAEKAAHYFEAAEIIELHHDQKRDAPSGTALKTAEVMQAVRPTYGESAAPAKETLEGARGANLNGLRIHSVRLPGLLAHQEVLFGGQGQILTLRHDALSRACYMPGVLLGIRKVMQLNSLVNGLEHLL